MKNILIWIWCFPQQLAGFILTIILKKHIYKIKYYKKARVYYFNTPVWIFGVSLGTYILLSREYESQKKTVPHEYGHTKQSFILGWLYLIIVGLPSALFNLISRLSPKFSENYYNRFPENWADKLGDVVR